MSVILNEFTNFIDGSEFIGECIPKPFSSSESILMEGNVELNNRRYDVHVI